MVSPLDDLRIHPSRSRFLACNEIAQALQVGSRPDVL